ncbi:hypothetical protein D5086_025890 [Populus alba]|uniref:Uncharacterized protein n=1 Tax=Populus alba TaxID=43335 RepID=A0ACC4B164_POPAL
MPFIDIQFLKVESEYEGGKEKRMQELKSKDYVVEQKVMHALCFFKRHAVRDDKAAESRRECLIIKISYTRAPRGSKEDSLQSKRALASSSCQSAPCQGLPLLRLSLLISIQNNGEHNDSIHHDFFEPCKTHNLIETRETKMFARHAQTL